jgi:hypothetical protein
MVVKNLQNLYVSSNEFIDFKKLKINTKKKGLLSFVCIYLILNIYKLLKKE